MLFKSFLILLYVVTTLTAVLSTNVILIDVNRVQIITKVATGLKDMKKSLIGVRLIVIIFVIVQRYKKIIFVGYNQIK